MDLRMLLSVLGVGGTPWEPCRVRGLGKMEAPVDCVGELANHSGFSDTQRPAIFFSQSSATATLLDSPAPSCEPSLFDEASAQETRHAQLLVLPIHQYVQPFPWVTSLMDTPKGLS